MNAEHKHWRIRGGRRLTPAPFLVAGIVNLTPDSFSGNGCAAEEAGREVARHVRENADIVDIGAESTRPGACDIGPAEEWQRLAAVLPSVFELRRHIGEAAQSAVHQAAPQQRPQGLSQKKWFAISIDTYRASTAASALALPSGDEDGVDIINDIAGGSFDPAMAEVLAQYKPGYVLGHCPERPAVMQENPHYTNIVDELMQWFTKRMDCVVKAGLPEECICLDPCIGFGKTLEHNIAVIAAIPRFASLGRPLFFGISRKSVIGGITGQPVDERDISTQVLTALLAESGVEIHRVHRVADTVHTLQLVRAIRH